MSRWEKFKEFFFGSVVKTEVVYKEVQVKEPYLWIDFEKVKPEISHDEILIRNFKGVVLVARYLEGKYGDKQFYFHDDRKVQHFKVAYWSPLPTLPKEGKKR